MISLLIILTPLTAASEAIPSDPSLQLEVKAAILIDAETGQVLYEYNADDLRPPASMTKMMTEYLVMDAVKSGSLQWDEVVTISERAGSIGGSGGLLAPGQKYTVRDLFRIMSIYSGNDASVALAEYLSTSEENFVEEMNRKAREIGLSEGAYFVNATGLDNEDYGEWAPKTTGKTVITARDAALLAQSLIQEHPDILEFTSTPQAYRVEGDESTELMNNWNWMLESWIPLNNIFSKQYAYEGLDGLKTGYTSEAGYCFTGTAIRDGMRLISVVMGTNSEPERFQETAKLLDYGFNNFEKRTILTAKSELNDLKMVSIKKGKENEVNVVTEEGVTLVVRKNTTPEQIQIKTSVFEPDQLIAPIQQGQKVGTVTVTYDGPVGQEVVSVNLIAAEDMEKASWIKLLFRSIGTFFSNVFSGIKNIF